MVFSTIDGKKKNRRAVVWVSWNIKDHKFKWWTTARSYYEAVSSIGWGEIPGNYAASRLYDAPDKVIEQYNNRERKIDNARFCNQQGLNIMVQTQPLTDQERFFIRAFPKRVKFKQHDTKPFVFHAVLNMDDGKVEKYINASELSKLYREGQMDQLAP